MAIENTHSSPLVGRLHNRSTISQGNTIFERPLLVGKTPSGGGFSPQRGKLLDSPTSVTKVPEKCPIDKDFNGEKKARYFEDNRQLVEDDLEYVESIDENESVQYKKKPLHLEIQETQSRTALASLPSEMSRHKRKRQTRKKVSFDGEQILLKKSHQVDVVLHCEFVDLVKVLYIPHFSTYSKGVSESLWYSQGEIERMKSEYLYWKKMTRKAERRASIARKVSQEGREHTRRHLRRKQTIAAVFSEQERQRRMCERIYGKIVDSTGNHSSSSCIIDRERLREVYRRAGNIVKRNHEAVQRATADHHLKLYLSSIGKQGGPVSTTTDIEKQDEAHYQHGQPIEDWPSMNISRSKCCFEMSTTFNDSINCVFQTLLEPFLDQRRKSSLFLDVGDEMIVVTY